MPYKPKTETLFTEPGDWREGRREGRKEGGKEDRKEERKDLKKEKKNPSRLTNLLND